MPQVTENEDGTKTLSINSGELRVVKEVLEQHVPEFKKVWDFLEGPDVKATVDFVKSALI